jgi:ribosomal protein L7/L12
MNWVQGQQLQNGRYVIEKVLGRGGFGITYKARHTFLNYDVVIKTPNEDVKSDPNYAKYVDRFIKEGRMLAQLSNEPHPHIVRISDLFREGDTHCLVMDFIPGESLWHLVGHRGALSETEAVEYIRQIGSALSVVHQQNLVHLDVTPPNIMVRNNGKAVLIDFGIAADMSPPSTLSRTFGNQTFAPYELLYKGRRHTTVDIYCLAASLYYAVTGQCPTKSFDRKYEGIELKALKQLVPSISDGLNQAILQGMALEAQDRPQSVQEWLQLLTQKAHRRQQQQLSANSAVSESKEQTRNCVLPQQTLFDVFLEEFPADKKIAILKVVRMFTDLGLKEAKDIVESVPQIAGSTFVPEVAEDFKQQLEEVGAKVSINSWQLAHTWPGFSVILEKFPVDKKIPILKVVRTLTRLGLKEAKDLVESAPITVGETLIQEVAENFQQQLEEAGAKVYIHLLQPIQIKPEKFDVILEKFPVDKKIPILKVVRTLTRLGLKEAKDLVESAPITVGEALLQGVAEDFQQQLEEAGAKVYIRLLLSAQVKPRRFNVIKPIVKLEI